MDKKQNKDLHKAASKGDVAGIKKALAAGADVNLPDKKGNTPLHSVVSSGAADACKALLEAGADPRLPNLKGVIPADYADEKKKKAVAQVLREHSGGGYVVARARAKR
jgi:ankyrin repeat protein